MEHFACNYSNTSRLDSRKNFYTCISKQVRPPDIPAQRCDCSCSSLKGDVT